MLGKRQEEDGASMSQFDEEIFGPMDLPEGVLGDLPDDMPFARGAAVAETTGECETAGDGVDEDVDDSESDAFGEETDSF